MRESAKYFLVCFTLIMCNLWSVNSITLGSCVQYSLDGSRCEKCIENYHNFDGRCYVDILGCRVYNFGNICLECQKDYILVNNYCCDKTCISQMYKEGNSTLLNGDINAEESERIEDLLTKIKQEIFSKQQVKVSSISLQKYKDVVRYYFLYEYTNGTITIWRRIVYDCHILWKQYLWVDDSILADQLNFQLIPLHSITEIQKVRDILSQFPDIYSQVDPSLSIIKQAQVNKVRQYQVFVHNQNSLKAFYRSSMNNKTVFLYDITLAPQYFKLILMGQYLNQSYQSLKFLQFIKGMLEKNSSYTNNSIKAVQIYNSSSVNEPLKVSIYSQGQSIRIKTMFEVFYSSISVISEIKLVSSKIQNREVPPILWSIYLQEQNTQMKRAMQLILSGYNSSKEIPSTYIQDNKIMDYIQFECKVQKWKLFTKYHFYMKSKTLSMQVKVIKIDYSNEYRIQMLNKVETINKPVVTTVNRLVDNFTINQTQGTYQRTVQGWSSIQIKLNQSLYIKSVLQWFILRTQYKLMGSKVNITKLVQTASKYNTTHLNYTIIAENATHYMKAIIQANKNYSTDTSSTLPKILSVQYMQKQQKNFIQNYLNSTLNSTYHFKDNSSIGVKVYYSYNSKWTIFTNFTYPYANTLQNRFRDTYKKSRNTSGTLLFDNVKLLDSYIINSTYSTVPTNFIVQYQPCPTSPYTEYIWIFNYNKTGNICHEMRFLQITQNLTKKIIINGYTYTHSESGCNYTYKFSFNSSLNNILPKNSFSSTGIFSRSYFKGTAVMQTFNFNITQMNSTFQTFMKTKYNNNSDINKMYVNFRSEQIYALEMFNRYTPYIRWDKFRTDSNNVSYQLVSYIPSHYFKNKTIPSYSGSFDREYHHVCVGLNRSRLFDDVFWRNKFTNESQWVKPNVTDWYGMMMGKENVYNTGFVEDSSLMQSVNGVSSSQQLRQYSLVKNESLKLLQSDMVNVSLNNISVNSIVQMVVIEYQLYRVYLMRVNITVNSQIDMIVLSNKLYNNNNNNSNKSLLLLQVVSYMGLNREFLQTVSMKKSIVFKVIGSLNINSRYTYLEDVLHSEYALFLTSKFKQIDNKLDELIKPKIQLTLSSIRYNDTVNSTDTITLNKLYYSRQFLNNETVMVKVIYQINYNSSSIKYYFVGSYLMKCNLTKQDITQVNTTYGVYYLYLLQYKVINVNRINVEPDTINMEGNENTINTEANHIDSNINTSDSKDNNSSYNIYSTTTVQSIVTNTIITNYTLPTLFNFYNNTNTQNIDTNSTSYNNNITISDNSSYFNIVTFNSNNISQGTQKFNNLTSSTGKLLEDGQLVQVKYYPTINLIHLVDDNITNINNNSQYTKISIDLNNKILTLVQSKYKQKLYHQNISSTVLIIQKLSDPQQFISYSILIISTLKYYNTTLSTIQTKSTVQTKVYLLRFTYLSYKQQYFTSMGQTILSNVLYDIADKDIKSENMLYFEPMKRVSYLNYLSSFIYQVIQLVNSYLELHHIQQRVVLIRELFYRSYLKGGFYKVQMSLQSNRTAIGYILQTNYQYRVMKVNMIPLNITINDNNNNQSVDNNKNTTVNNEQTMVSNDQSVNITGNYTFSQNTTTIINNNTTIIEQFPSTSITISYSSLLQQQIFTSLQQNIYILYLRQILTKLKLQYYHYLINCKLTAYSISESIDGQFYSLTYQSLVNIDINININTTDDNNNNTPNNTVRQISDIIIYRCNSTCLQYNGSTSSLYILTCIKTYQLTNGTIIDIQDITHNLTMINTNVNNSQLSIHHIIQSFYYYSNNNTTHTNQSSLHYNIPINQQQSLITIFQSIYNQQSITNIDPLLLKYQKYLLLLKQHLSSILYRRESKIIDQYSMNQQTNYIIKFIRQRYSLIFSQDILLMIVQNTHSINNHTQYSVYFVTQHLGLIQLNQQQQWNILIVNVSSIEVYSNNYHVQVKSISQWVRNGKLTNNNTSIISTTYNNNKSTSYNDSEEIDIAFGYVPVNNIDSLNLQPEFNYIMQQLNNKYPSLILNRTISKAQKLQLKNGTTTYKLLFTQNNNTIGSSSSLDRSHQNNTVKVIAVYRGDEHRVQILNKLYLPNQNYQPIKQQQLINNDIINNTVSLVQQLHGKQLSSPFLTVNKVQVTAQSPSTTKQIQRYRMHLTLPDGKSYSTIVDYNPTIKTINQVSFNQLIQLPKDSLYRLNVYQKEHSQGFNKVQQTQLVKDNLYQIVLNKLKQIDTNFIKTLLVYKKSQPFTFFYKVVYLSNDNSTLTNQQQQTNLINIEDKKLYEVLISVNPSQRKVQSLQSPYRLNITQGFSHVRQWEISQQQLMKIINQFRSMYNISANSPMLVNSTMKKMFLNGILVKVLLFVKAQDNTTRTYEILAYSQFYVNKFTLQTVTSLLHNFQYPCSTNQACTLCRNQVDYILHQNKICTLRINNCKTYSIDIAKNILLCQQCLNQYQLFDNKCLQQSIYPQLWK